MGETGRYFSLLSSIGVTLCDNSGPKVISTPPAISRRALLAKASTQAFAPPADDSLAEQLASEIRMARIANPSLRYAPADTRGLTLDFSKPEEIGDRFHFSPDQFEPHRVAEHLENFGLEIRTAGDEEDTHDDQINFARVVPLVEVIRRSDGRVIAGGKGLDKSTAFRGAVAEAVERIVAENSAIDVFASSARKLQMDHGLLVPSFDVGPRDAYSDDLVIDWIMGQTIKGDAAALPAERAFYNYVPRSGVAAFSLQHTVGLAAGNSREEAVWAALSEVMERDAYWLVMRCRIRCPVLDNSSLFDLYPDLQKALARAGLRIVLKDFTLDWPINIVHALTIDGTGRIPAYAHGVGSGICQTSAALKAVLECLQLHAGLARRCEQARQPILFGGMGRAPDLVWSDPSSAEKLDHLFSCVTDSFASPSGAAAKTVTNILNLIEESAEPIIWSYLGALDGLHVVRVYLQNSLMPQPNLEHVPSRLHTWLEKSGLRYPYSVPILT